MDAAIELINIRKTYGKQVAVRQFSLTVGQGEFVTMIGSSGCGKTTVLKMINGLILPDSGRVLINGRDIAGGDLIALRRNIGYAIQGSVLFPHMTVEKNIAYVPSLLNKHDRRKTSQAVRKWLKLVGLDESLLQRYPGELSGGQQQRVGIARALAASPEILLMDEPFGAVDGITRGQLQAEIARIHRQTGITVVFVTHDISEAVRLGTKMLVMNEGAIVQYDQPDTILRQPANEFVRLLAASGRKPAGHDADAAAL
ncbi:MAG: ABC transporter ATP-binding protein [Sporomusaceae bacterium]|nr:ABC transporter ATP-binding protein [Sporomusaceae bacterium]